MASSTDKVECLDCGTALPLAPPEDGHRPPCPRCGSLRRAVTVSLSMELKLETHLDTHARHPAPRYKAGNKNKPALERWSGDSRSSDGVYRRRTRVLDRLGNRYEETVLDPDGSVRHHQAHPLKEHTGHGSDKPKAEPAADPSQSGEA